MTFRSCWLCYPSTQTCSQVTCCSSKVRYKVLYRQEIRRECIVLSSIRYLQLCNPAHRTYASGVLLSCLCLCLMSQYSAMQEHRRLAGHDAVSKREASGCSAHASLTLTNTSKTLPPSLITHSLCDVCPSM